MFPVGNSESRTARKKGFTLLEALLAIVLMAVGLVSVLQVISTGLFAGTVNENEIIAANLGQEKIEELENASYTDIVDEDKDTVPGFSSFSREVIVSVLQAGLKEVTVKVYWTAKSDEMDVTIITYASQI